MIPLRTSAVCALVVALSWWLPVPADAGRMDGTRFVRALDRMMAGLAARNARASAAIQHAYREHLDLLMLGEYTALAGALQNGGLVPLPPDSPRFNVVPRLTGASPIGEKDLEHQADYVAARPAAMGALLDIASRVRSGPVEVTSLVRHAEYQTALGATNPNAKTALPMHTMGLAFDIALVNTPLETVYEIRDVLIEMQNAGDILFIGERRQLVFHVVPHPSRLGYFTHIYTQAIGAPGVVDGVRAMFSPSRELAGTSVTGGHAAVRADIAAVFPAPEFSTAWWEAQSHDADMSVEVSAVQPARLPPPPPPPPAPTAFPKNRAAILVLIALLGVMAGAVRAAPGSRISALSFADPGKD